MKNISGKTLIFYTFQTSSKIVQYNVTTFKKSAPQQPKIRDVLYELPLDYQNNSYHFRFRSQFFEGDQKIIGWIDISNLLAKVPLINSSIFVKILQLPGDRQNKLFNKEKLKAIGLLDPLGTTSNNNVNINTNTNKNTNKVNISAPSTQSQNQSQNQNKAVNKSQTAQKTGDFLDFEIDHKNGVNTARSGSAKKQQANTNTNTNAQNKPYIPGSQTPQQRLQGFQAQCQRQQQQRRLQREAIAFHQQKLTEWGYSGHKTINNLTTLLATLHTIWPEWQPVSLSDMLKPEDVNALYKKVVIRLHPDKNHDKDYNTKYLSKRIFQLLNQAKKAQK